MTPRPPRPPHPPSPAPRSTPFSAPAASKDTSDIERASPTDSPQPRAMSCRRCREKQASPTDDKPPTHDGKCARLKSLDKHLVAYTIKRMRDDLKYAAM